MISDGFNSKLTLKENIEVLGLKKRNCDEPFHSFVHKFDSYEKAVSVSRYKDIVMVRPDADDLEYNISPLVWQVCNQAVKKT